MASLSLYLLGGFDAVVNGSEPFELPTRKGRALLAWLALNLGRRISRDMAIGLLWGDRPQKQANASLNQTIYELRKALGCNGHELLRTDHEVIALSTEDIEVDALEFSRLARSSDCDDNAHAERLYRGDLLAGFVAPTREFEDWVETERRRFRTEGIEVLTTLVAWCAQRGDAAQLPSIAHHLVELDPYNEFAHRALMTHFAAQEQLGLSNEVYETLHQRLREELDISPSEETEALRARIMQREITSAKNCARTGEGPIATQSGQSARRTASFGRLGAVLAAAIAIIAGSAWWWSSAPDFKPVDPAIMANPLPATPSIAVLAFDDLSIGEDRHYLSDAISEGIITQLSKFTGIFVIARNSSFHYRGKAMDAREIARELGVRYILEGSQQKAGNQLRVTVQLIDAVGGNHVWAESYDGEMADILRVQDEIGSSVASALGEKLRKIAGEEAKRADPAQLRAFELVLRGLWQFREFTREGSDQARKSYEAALAIEPDLGEAHAGLAWIYINGYRWGWTELEREDSLVRAQTEAQTALRIAPESYESHFAMAAVHMQAGRRAQAIAEYEKTLKLNPNAGNVMATYAEQLGYAGRFGEAVEWLQKAMRLDPHHPEWFYWNLGWAQYSLGDCDSALATMRNMSRLPPFANRTLAAIFVCLGRLDDARDAIDALLVHDPDYSVAKFRLNFKGKYDNPHDLEVWIDDLRKAGLPE